jgi:hypothetical protein
MTWMREPLRAWLPSDVSSDAQRPQAVQTEPLQVAPERHSERLLRELLLVLLERATE